MWTVGHFWRGSQDVRGCWVGGDGEEWWQLAGDPGPLLLPSAPPPPLPLLPLFLLFPPSSLFLLPWLSFLSSSSFCPLDLPSFPSGSGILECQRPGARIVLRETGFSQSCSILEMWCLWVKKLISRLYLVPGFRSDVLLLLFHWIVSITLEKPQRPCFSGEAIRAHGQKPWCPPALPATYSGSQEHWGTFPQTVVLMYQERTSLGARQEFLQNSYGWLLWALGRKWA